MENITNLSKITTNESLNTSAYALGISGYLTEDNELYTFEQIQALNLKTRHFYNSLGKLKKLTVADFKQYMYKIYEDPEIGTDAEKRRSNFNELLESVK